MKVEDPISISIDASEFSFASAEPLRGIISRYGRPAVARAFADFQQTGLSDLAVQLYQMGFSLVHCPTWPNGDGVPKTVVSDVMAQDLRDQLEELDEVVDTYLLVAASREYIAVANALRRHDRRVVVIAEEAKVCKELRLCADEFVVLPPARPERSAEARSSRSSEPLRAERLATERAERLAAERAERAAEAVRFDRAERLAEALRGDRTERAPEVLRGERQAEPARPERTPERLPERLPERTQEPSRAERAPEPARGERPESADAVRLPSDAEVLAEVRRIVAAEGICTPRRLARALCPVDRSASGELRSRIANRIQALVDAGKLQRERLVVGGTSVETILAREERDGHAARVAGPESESAPTLELPATPPSPLKEPEPEPVGFLEAGGNGGSQVELFPEVFPEVAGKPAPVELEKVTGMAGSDLDALVESVLMSPERAAELLGREPEPEPEMPVASPVEEAPPMPEPPKRTRRRRTSSRAAVPEPNGAS